MSKQIITEKDYDKLILDFICQMSFTARMEILHSMANKPEKDRRLKKFHEEVIKSGKMLKKLLNSDYASHKLTSIFK